MRAIRSPAIHFLPTASKLSILRCCKDPLNSLSSKIKLASRRGSQHDRGQQQRGAHQWRGSQNPAGTFPKNSEMQLRTTSCHRWADSGPPSGALSCKEHCGIVVGLYVETSDHVQIATPFTTCCATLRLNVQVTSSGNPSSEFAILQAWSS